MLPLPFYLIAPGSAIDLSSTVIVGHTAAPRDRFFLTDVAIIHASPLRLLFALSPDVALTRVATIMPLGVTPQHFADLMQTAMTQSQAIAAVVAERAAGFAVPLPAASVEVERIDPASRAFGILAAGDIVRGLDGHVVRGTADVRSALRPLRPGTSVRITLDRHGRSQTVQLRTVALNGGTRLGVILTERYAPARLVVPVRYTIGDVGGSSGGLMMALRIYDSLHARPGRAERSIAGTGTIGLDGRIGAIEGTRQKLVAAKRAGARIFFVPRANYADVSAERDIRVIPVDTFGQALRALDG